MKKIIKISITTTLSLPVYKVLEERAGDERKTLASLLREILTKYAGFGDEEFAKDHLKTTAELNKLPKK